MSTREPVLIRPAIVRDYPRIAEIYNESIVAGGVTLDEEEFNASHIASWVAKYHDRERLLVLEKSGDVQGWGCIKRYSDRPGYSVCCETSIYLSQWVKGQGYGRRLQAEILRQAEQLNYHHVVAKIVASNQGSIRFHEKFGFELVGIQKEIGFSRGQWYDVALLQLILQNASRIGC